MSKPRKPQRAGGTEQRNLSVRAVRRDPPDLRKLSRAFIALAQAQAEADAEAQARKALLAKPATLPTTPKSDEVSSD